MDKKFKIGDVVYVGTWGGVKAYRVGTIKTNEWIGGSTVEMRADKKGNETYLNPTDTFADEESARLHMVKIITADYERQMADFEQGSTDISLI